MRPNMQNNGQPTAFSETKATKPRNGEIPTATNDMNNEIQRPERRVTADYGNGRLAKF